MGHIKGINYLYHEFPLNQPMGHSLLTSLGGSSLCGHCMLWYYIILYYIVLYYFEQSTGANSEEGRSVILNRPLFSRGQYYVAKSRVGEKAALMILVVGERRSDEAVITDNVVYPEVL